MKAAQTKSSGICEKARTAAAATSAAASAAAVKEDRFILITICQGRGCRSFPDPLSSGDARRLRILSDRHAGVEARKPMHDCVTRDRRVSELAMLLRSLARREYPRRHRPGADEPAHGPMHPADVEQMILLAFGHQDVLLDVVQDAVERMLRNRRKEVERRLCAGNVHPLDHAPFKYGARQALPGHDSLGALAVTGLE